MDNGPQEPKTNGIVQVRISFLKRSLRNEFSNSDRLGYFEVMQPASSVTINNENAIGTLRAQYFPSAPFELNIFTHRPAREDKNHRYYSAFLSPRFYEPCMRKFIYPIAGWCRRSGKINAILFVAEA